MSCDCPDDDLESHRAYQFLELVELLLTVLTLSVSVAVTAGSL